MTIRAGIGGWTYQPWRGTFYPPGLPQARELAHASRQVTAIEINGTFYRTQTPATYRAWRAETPDDFVFTLKAPRFAVGRKDLATASPSIARFIESGPTELGDRLGPILWQLPPTKRFERAEIDAFLALLPRAVDGREVRHAIEVRHDSFVDPLFVALARRHDVAIVLADSSVYPLIPNLTGAVVYARLLEARAEEPAGYAPDVLRLWARRAFAMAEGRLAGDLTPLTSPEPDTIRRDVFVFFINGAKERAPAAARAFLDLLAPAPLP